MDNGKHTKTHHTGAREKLQQFFGLTFSPDKVWGIFFQIIIATKILVLKEKALVDESILNTFPLVHDYFLVI